MTATILFHALKLDGNLPNPADQWPVRFATAPGSPQNVLVIIRSAQD